MATAQPASALVEERLLRRQIILFFLLTYAIAWVFFVPLALSTAGLGWLPFPLSLPLMTVLGTAGPSLGALVTIRITERRWPVFRFTPDPKRVLLSLIAALVLIA